MHTIDYQSIGLEKFGNSAQYYERQIATWTRNYKMAETHTIQSANHLMEWLPKNVPASTKHDRATIVHGDYKMDNVVFHPTENRVIAVLDWECTCFFLLVKTTFLQCCYNSVDCGPSIG